MADRNDRERQRRRFDEDKDFQNRGGALDRSGGYSDRRESGPNQQKRQSPSRGDSSNRSNMHQPGPNQPDRMQQGPYTGYGPRGYRRTDERIQEDICDRLTQHAQIDASDIEVAVLEGEVTLTGTVEDRRIKRMVEANVEMIPGVVDIHNQLRLRKPPTREEEARRKLAEEMADKFPGGPTPTGPAGYEP